MRMGGDKETIRNMFRTNKKKDLKNYEKDYIAFLY